MSDTQTYVPVETEAERLQRLRKNLTCVRWKREQTMWSKINEYVVDYDAQAYVVLQRNGQKELQVYNSLPGKNWVATSKNFMSLMTTEFPVPDLRTPGTMGPTKKQRLAMEADLDDEHDSPRKATAEEIAAILTVPGEEYDPAALNVRHTRRLGVLKGATLTQEIQANMSRRSTIPYQFNSNDPAARPFHASDIRKSAPRLPAHVPRTPAPRPAPASHPPPIADISSTMSARPVAPLPRLTSSLIMSDITRTAQTAPRPSLPVGYTKTSAQGSGLLPAPEIVQDRTERVDRFTSASFLPTPAATTVSNAAPTVTRPVTVFKHGGNDMQMEELCSPTSSPYPREALTDSPEPIQYHGRPKRAPAWHPVENAATDQGRRGRPSFSTRRSKRQRRR